MAELLQFQRFLPADGGPDVGPTPVLNLYCCRHRANHVFSLVEVERIVYALGFAAPVAYAGRVGPNYPHPECLLSVLEDSTLPMEYKPGVDANVELRVAGEEWTQ